MNNISLKYRIALVIFIIEVIMISVLLTRSLSVAHHFSQEQMSDNEQVTLELLSKMSRTALFSNEYAGLQVNIEQIANHNYIRVILIVDADNTIVASTDLSQIGLTYDSQIFDADEGWYEYEITSSSGYLGLVIQQLSDTALIDSFAKIQIEGFFIAIFGIAVSGLVGIGSGILLTRNLEQLTRTTKRFADGDLNAEIRIQGTGDVAQIANAFNEMARKIEANSAKQQGMKETLYDSERPYRQLVEDNPVGILVQHSGKILYVNSQGLNIFGASSEKDIIGKSIWAMSHPDYHELIRNRVQQIEKDFSRQTDTLEEQFIRMDGSLIDVEVVGIPTTYMGESAIQVVFWDITKRKQSDRLQIESEERYRSLFENSLEGIYRSTPEGRFTDVNPALVQMLGYNSKEEVLALELSDDLYADTSQHHQLLTQLEEYNVLVDTEVILKKKDGQTFTVNLNDKAIRDSTGEILYYEGFIQDITERKKMETALFETNMRLFELNTKLAQTQAISHIGGWEWIVSTDEILWSDELYQISRLSPDIQLSSKFIRELIHPKDRNAYIENMRQVFAEGSKKIEQAFRIIRPDGRVRYIYTISEISYDETGWAVKVVGTAQDVTGSKQMETALRVSEERFKLFMEHFPGLAFIKDKNARMLFANKALIQYLGISENEIIGKSNDDLISSENLEKTTREEVEVLETGQSISYEFKGVNADSMMTDLLIIKFAIPQENASPLLGGMAFDITERKQAEKEINRRNQELTAIATIATTLNNSLDLDTILKAALQQFESAPIGIGIVTVDGHFLQYNNFLLELTGYSATELEQLSVIDLYQNEEDREPFLNLLKKDGFVKDFELDLKRKDGTPYVASVTSTLLLLDKQEMLFTMIQDITARKQAEKEREYLLVAEHEQRVFAETLKEATIALSSKITLKAVLNEILYQAHHIISYDSANIMLLDEDILQPTVWLGYDIHGGEELFSDAVYSLPEFLIEAQVLQSGEAIVISDTHQDSRWVLFDETSWIRSDIIVPIFLRDRPLGVLHLDSRIPNYFNDEDALNLKPLVHVAAIALENARLYSDLQDRIIELKDKNAELERFTYTVSHDLKSPLITIQGFLGLLEQDVEAGDKERIAQDQTFIRDAANKMKELLDDLLELSRIGRLMNPPQNINLRIIVDESLSLVQGQISERGVNVSIADNLPIVRGDPQRLREVFQNLLDNAAKFMGDQINPQIDIGVIERDNIPIIFVRDNGIGIKIEYHEKVFGLFEKLKPDDNGTGIGLALVKRIVEFHGGKIWVESKGIGQGSTFFIILQYIESSNGNEQ